MLSRHHAMLLIGASLVLSGWPTVNLGGGVSISAPAFTGWKTASTEDDSGACYSNDTEHVSSNDTRVEGSCTSSFRLSNFGFTSGDIPSGSTINGIELHYEAHGGSASQAARRRLDIWIVDETGTDCETAAAPGRDNHDLPQNAEDDSTWTANDAADALWGCTWNQADILHTNFGTRWIHTSDVGGNVVGIDFVEIRVNYTAP
jgi:hypothetical protein